METIKNNTQNAKTEILTLNTITPLGVNNGYFAKLKEEMDRMFGIPEYILKGEPPPLTKQQIENIRAIAKILTTIEERTLNLIYRAAIANKGKYESEQNKKYALRS